MPRPVISLSGIRFSSSWTLDSLYSPSETARMTEPAPSMIFPTDVHPSDPDAPGGRMEDGRASTYEQGAVMSADVNIKTVGLLYEAFGRGDIETILSNLTDDVDWATEANGKGTMVRPPHWSCRSDGLLRGVRVEYGSRGVRASDLRRHPGRGADDRVVRREEPRHREADRAPSTPSLPVP